MTEKVRKAFAFEVPDEEGPMQITVNEETVDCQEYVDGLKLLQFMSAMRDPAMPAGSRATSIVTWLKHCIVDWESFEKLSERLRLRIEDLAEIAGVLADEYAERPTKSAEPSSAGQTTTGSSSEASSSSMESTTGG